MSKLLREYVKEILKEDTSGIQNVGDLKKLIKQAKSKKRQEKGKEEIKGAITDAIVDEITGKIPGLAAAKSMFGALKNMYSLDDEARTGTALDYLDVDDDVSAIVDDPIENKFLKAVAKEIETMPDETPLENLDMTKLLSKFIQSEFNQRTVAGFE
jgi:hypothetical protein